MSEDIDRLTPQRAHRPRGRRMKAAERKTVQEAFLKALASTANVRASCMAANVSHATIYQWQEHDLTFSMRFEQAQKEANDLLFGEAWRRAMHGEEVPVVSGGRILYKEDGSMLTVRHRSDRLLELLLKARLPEFREKGPVVAVTLPKEYLFNPDQDGVERS
jgi:hypothetical protein